MKNDIFQIVIDKNFEFDEVVKEFPIIYTLKDIPQNPKYHKEGNVFIHTQNACNELIKLGEWSDFNDKKKVILYLATMFHDIGKISCTKIEYGQIVSPKHAIKGGKVFREIIYKEYAKKYNIDFQTREEIAALIKYHGLPLLFMEKEGIEYNLIKCSECLNMELLYVLSKVDLLGRECDDKKELLNKIDYFKEYSKEIWCFYSEKAFVNDYTRFKYFNDTNIWHGNEIFDSTSFEVIVMVGFPLAGKDSYIQENLNHLCVISLDNIREEFNISPREDSSKVAMIAKERAKEFLRGNKSFVWNATNIVFDTRKKLCNLFSNYGARVKYIYVEVPYDELISRNKTRDRSIPENVLNKMIHKFDMLENHEGYKTEYYIN